jgi:hypothetical protein
MRLSDGTLVAVQHDVSDRPEAGESVHLRLRGRLVSAMAREREIYAAVCMYTGID